MVISIAVEASQLVIGLLQLRTASLRKDKGRWTKPKSNLLKWWLVQIVLLNIKVSRHKTNNFCAKCAIDSIHDLIGNCNLLITRKGTSGPC